MKLRNKKTGEIQECSVIPIIDSYVNEYEVFEKAGSLAELNENWEDYEEPKEYWYIDFSGEVKEFELLGFDWQGWMKEIGNYFETEEEAKKAVEKLKAWKRLKDNGISFSLDEDGTKPFIQIHSKKETGTFRLVLSITEDLELLFGVEE